MKGTGTRDSHFPSSSPLPSFLHISDCFGINMSSEWTDWEIQIQSWLNVCVHLKQNRSGGSWKESLEAGSSQGEFLGARVVGDTICKTGKALGAFLC